MTLALEKRLTYRGHILNCHPEALDDGRFQARVAIACVGTPAQRSQRFLDLETCGTIEAAVVRARQVGMAWVDRECSRAIGAGQDIRSD